MTAIVPADSVREIAQEDDARREAEAKKITDGHYRHKRRGNDFLSDEEDEETRSRRLTKKQRRQRKLEREDGLYKLGMLGILADVHLTDPLSWRKQCVPQGIRAGPRVGQ